MVKLPPHTVTIRSAIPLRRTAARHPRARRSSGAALFEADGTITHVFLLKRLSFGLDQAAIEAVQKIKFEPKEKDGKPIPSVVTIVYSFSIR